MNQNKDETTRTLSNDGGSIPTTRSFDCRIAPSNSKSEDCSKSTVTNRLDDDLTADQERVAVGVDGREEDDSSAVTASRFPKDDPNRTLSGTASSSSTATPSLSKIDPNCLRSGPGSGDASTEATPAIAGYEIKREIGRGGMGRVYLAREVELKRMVALKTMLPTMEPTACDRFFAEARAAGSLNHANIVVVHDCSTSGARPFYTMQLVQSSDGGPAPSGRQLVRRFKQNNATQMGLNELVRIAELESVPIPPAIVAVAKSPKPYFQLVAHWIAEAADAVDCAHRAGILHRDIKPSNLLLCADGRMMLADFGLARSSDDPEMTGRGTMMGTTRYMAPERFITGVAFDKRCDIYALGLTLYELLTFQAAFTEEDPLLLVEHIRTQEPLAPRIINPEIPAALDRICRIAMARSPEARYQTAAECARDLREWLAGDAVIVPPVPSRKRGWSILEKVGAAIALVALALTADALITPRVTGHAPFCVRLAQVGSAAQTDRKSKDDIRESESNTNSGSEKDVAAIDPSTESTKAETARSQSHESQPKEARAEKPSVPDDVRAPMPDANRAPVVAIWFVDTGDATKPEFCDSHTVGEKFDSMLEHRAEKSAKDIQSRGILSATVNESDAGIHRKACQAGADYILVVWTQTRAGQLIEPGNVVGTDRRVDITEKPGHTTVTDQHRTANDATALYSWSTTMTLEIRRTQDGATVWRRGFTGKNTVQSKGAAGIDQAMAQLVANEAGGVLDRITSDWRSFTATQH